MIHHLKKKNNQLLLLKIFSKMKILKNNGLIIIHRHKKEDLEITSKFKYKDIRYYGLSKVIFAKY